MNKKLKPLKGVKKEKNSKKDCSPLGTEEGSIVHKKLINKVDNSKIKEKDIDIFRNWIDTNKETIPEDVLKSMLLLLVFFDEIKKYDSISKIIFFIRTLLGLKVGSEKNIGNGKKDAKPRKKETSEEREKRLNEERNKRENREKLVIESLDKQIAKSIEEIDKEKLLILQERKNLILNNKFKILNEKEFEKYILILNNIGISMNLNVQERIEDIVIIENENVIFKDSMKKDENLEKCENIYGSMFCYDENMELEIIRVKLMDSPNISQDVYEKAKEREKRGEVYPVNTRKIKEIDIQYREYQYEIENTTLPDGSKIYAQSADPIAPPHRDYSYLTIVNVVLLVVNFAIPMHRVAKMLSDIPDSFSVNGIWEMILYMAERLEPIYKQLAIGLNKCSYIQYDDVNTRVLYSHSEDEKEKSPESISDRIDAYLPKISQKKSEPENKEKIYTSFITGLSEKDNERSRIMFYNTHQGSSGNCISNIIKLRDHALDYDKKLFVHEIKITSDSSHSNDIDLDVIKKYGLKIYKAGCLAHARRGFVRYRDLDPEQCDAMLGYFREIYAIEETINRNFPNNKEMKKDLRMRYSGEFYRHMMINVKSFRDDWKEQNIKVLEQKANYILNHKEEFDLIFMDPDFELDNNFSERGVRIEQIYTNNRLFYKTKNGRACFDVILTIIRTGIAAKVNLKEYLLWILKTDPEKVSLCPEYYTPFHYFKTMQKK